MRRRVGCPTADGLIKNRYIGRTFIQPDQRLRQLGVKLKFNALTPCSAAKRVVMIATAWCAARRSARGEATRDAGASEVHLGITFAAVSLAVLPGAGCSRAARS